MGLAKRTKHAHASRDDVVILLDWYLDGVRVRSFRTDKKGLPSPRAEAGQENIETVHEPKPIQTAGSLCMDKVAVLWKDPTAHRPRSVKEPVPSR